MSNLYDGACTKVDQRVGWYGVPLVDSLAVLVGVRNTLRTRNLYYTGVPQASTGNPITR
ncbi:hypothetical protein JAO29_01765 [Edaphobacter sp. HDX4]|uniref:hypothetical protein n=1 Tax=Edaphobacter sp. HDX4 TaxID=2794064 RepID=UPI002FE6830C